MLHSRLRSAPRRKPSKTTTKPAALAPDFHDTDWSSDIEESPGELFGNFLLHLFPDDAPSFHGDPGQYLLYSSPRYGELEIMIPSYPGQTGKKSEEVTIGLEEKEGAKENDSAAQKETHEIWSEYGETVMELGAALNGATEFNLRQNLLKRQPFQRTAVSIQAHEWGNVTDSFSQSYRGSFTRIIAADCYWMRSQHENLVRTIQWFLAPAGRVWCVAGFHTGRAIVAGFFETALKNGFEIEQIFERDLISRDEEGGEIRREWVPLREGENPENRQRWCVIAVLKKRQ
ncbi:uncharacterized protein N7496_009106 [Penicillium cataractarum]|uniref:Uncharacterized protein n=1 Tax=Penicillium cataractarum TaxID=2100454 RepID=A0A9W9RZQ5_9EURO|nr:uncharacterized protein N7496_009106 [Penicillium cataractarum]KAJ5369346.1 hypothetical protein N7496_009106 [Penicillium cataractarum]